MAKNIIAVDIGNSKFIVALVTQAGEVLYSERVPEGTFHYKEKITDLIFKSIEKMRREYGELNAGAVGVSVPAGCDSVRGIHLYNETTKVRNWHVRDDFENYLHMPVYVENDVNACAVGEKMFGNCKDTAHFMWVTLSFGCGGAFYLNNELYTGAHFMAGEVGHVVVEHDHPHRCDCGLYGDMEAEASGRGIGRSYLEKIGRPDDPEFRSKEVSELARKGDQLALETFHEAGVCLGRLCATATTMLNLEKAVIGGGVAVYDFDLLKPGLDETLPKLVFKTGNESFFVEKTALGYNASLLGAAALTLRDRERWDR